MNTGEKITLHLVLTRAWYDEVAAGTKRIEYRRICPHWKKMIWDRRDKIAQVRFQRAYAPNPPTSLFLVEKIDVGPCPYPGWDADYYRIHFAEVA
jgi:hypothetical protein